MFTSGGASDQHVFSSRLQRCALPLQIAQVFDGLLAALHSTASLKDTRQFDQGWRVLHRPLGAKYHLGYTSAAIPPLLPTGKERLGIRGSSD